MPESKNIRRGAVRIIGGRWRSRRIAFPEMPGLRPTPARVRETLFDWLGSWIEQCRVLDLFAGSGALGIEALSRGAAAAVFVEPVRTVRRALQVNLQRLGATQVEVVPEDALHYLYGTTSSFDLIFLDPPFGGDWRGRALDILQTRAGLLTDSHRVYVEYPARGRVSFDESAWQILRQTRAGQVQAALLGKKNP